GRPPPGIALLSFFDGAPGRACQRTDATMLALRRLFSGLRGGRAGTGPAILQRRAPSPAFPEQGMKTDGQFFADDLQPTVWRTLQTFCATRVVISLMLLAYLSVGID